MWKSPGMLCACLSLSLVVNPQHVQAADRVDLLLKLLQKKGIITAQEAEDLNREVEGMAARELPATSAVESDPGRPRTSRADESETPAKTPESEAQVELGTDGLWIRSRDNRFAVGIGGFLMTDLRYFGIDTPQHDFFDIRRARLSVEGRAHGDFHFAVQGEFEGSNTSKLRDGYLEWSRYPSARLRVGQYKQPFSIEYVTPLRYNPFIERSYISSLVPGRDVGIMVHGAFRDEALVYGLSFANGSGLDPGLDANSNKEFVGRLVLRPFWRNDHPLLAELRVGGSFSYGRIETLDLRDFEIQTAGLTPIFRISSAGKFGMVTEVDERRRGGVEVSWPIGPVLLQGEYADLGFAGLQGAVGDPFDAHMQAWHVGAVIFLTGEHPYIQEGILQGVRPKTDFNPTLGRWGAFSIGMRYDSFGVDEELFKVVDRLAYTEGAYAVTGALNWHLNPSVRLAVDLVHTEFADPVAIGYTFTDETFEDFEDVLISRFQLDF